MRRSNLTKLADVENSRTTDSGNVMVEIKVRVKFNAKVAGMWCR